MSYYAVMVDSDASLVNGFGKQVVGMMRSARRALAAKLTQTQTDCGALAAELGRARQQCERCPSGHFLHHCITELFYCMFLSLTCMIVAFTLLHAPYATASCPEILLRVWCPRACKLGYFAAPAPLLCAMHYVCSCSAHVRAMETCWQQLGS